MATPASILRNFSRDSVQRIHRFTRENRSLWYQLTVLQQPERARACGSGMKANSDRRPVDPPPVVELRIIEGPSVEEGEDVTFDYNANFFLYASLEQDRNIAHGRVHTPAASNPSILTGVPASGMAYLDRPNEAGYFIFPDLSVRHEGYFRLSFSLFETTKEEKDFDLEPAESELPPGVDWRMEIKTNPFNVYSAKKFPGLIESTPLSKTVADQGCRVRIRRDLRMKKRDGNSNGYDRRDDEYSRRRTVTPASDDPHSIRPRSLSNASEQLFGYGGDASRRPSTVGTYPPLPGYEAASPANRGHLSFGEAPAPQYATPRYYSQAGLPAPPASPGGPRPASQSPYGYHQDRALGSACPSPALSVKQEMHDRSSGGYVTPSPSAYSPADGHGRRDSHVSFNLTPSLPPPPPHQRTKSPKPYASLAPLRIASLVSPLPPIEAQTEPAAAAPEVPMGGKRKHEVVFQPNAHPLHNGKRQLDPYHGERAGAASDPGQGMYSRADGKVGFVTFSQWQ